MANRFAVLFLLLALLPIATAQAQGFPAQAPAQLGLGFSPGTISPVSEGSPVYAVGDQLWATSYQGDLSVRLLNASMTQLVTENISQGQITLLHTFSGADAPGQWAINISTTVVGFPVWYLVPFQMVEPGPIVPNLLRSTVNSAGVFSMAFSTNSSFSYDYAACMVGQSAPDSAQVPIPADLGGGSLLLRRDGNTTSVLPSGKVQSNFTFWYEIFADRSYALSLGGTTLTTRSIEEAASAAVPFSLGESAGVTSTIAQLTSIREGRAYLRAFFESSNGLEVNQTPLLIPGGPGWVWLPGCTSFSDQIGSDFTISASLNLPVSRWPRAIYFMYTTAGVDSFSGILLTELPAVVDLVSSPWGAPLTDAAGFVTSNSSGVTAAMGNSSIYLLSEHYPVQLALGFEGSSATQSVPVENPFTVSTAEVPAARVTVQSVYDGSPVANSNLLLRLGNATIAAGKGSYTFYVPTGDYVLEGTYKGVLRTSSLSAVAGATSNVTLEFGSSAGQDYWLTLSLAAGSIASAAIWGSLLLRWRRR